MTVTRPGVLLFGIALLMGAAQTASPPGRQPAERISRFALAPGFGPEVLAAADFNGDGFPDVALCGRSERFALLAGDGRGALRDTPQDAGCGAHPTALTAADLDGDGRPDLAVANHDTDYLTILINRPDGRFIARTVHVHSKPHPHMVAAADFNGDHLADLLTDSWGENRLTLLVATSAGEWPSPGTPVEAGRAPYVNVVAADLDGDGQIDVAYPNAAPSSASDTVSVLLGDGRGGFRQAPQSPLMAGPAPFMIALGDVNGDGRRDLVVANYSGHISDTARDGLTWIRNDGHGQFTPFPVRVAAGHGAWSVAAGDVNGDGFADAAIVNAADDSVAVAYGSRDGLHAGPTITVTPEPHRLVLADLDGDGRAEIFVTTESRDELVIASIR